jgi:hypothetical protein
MRELASLHRRLAHGAPPGWRYAASAVIIDRPFGFLLALSLMVTAWLLVVPAVSPPSANQGALALLGTVCAVGLARGVISGDRLHERRVIVFQSGGSPGVHYAKVMGLSIASLGLFLLIPACALVVRDASQVGALVVGGFLWACVLFLAAAGVSSLVRGFDLELSLLLLFASLTQGLVLDRPDVPDFVAATIRSVLLPIDGAFGTWNALLSGRDWPTTSALLHLGLHPVVALAVIWIRARDADIDQ